MSRRFSFRPTLFLALFLTTCLIGVYSQTPVAIADAANSGLPSSPVALTISFCPWPKVQCTSKSASL
jgi:hypothetical protein